MFLTSTAARRSRRLLLCLSAAALASLGALSPAPASAAPRPLAATPSSASTVSTVSSPAAAARSSATVASLAFTGVTTRVTVRRVSRTGQVKWINHVLDTRLVNVDGCQASRAATSWRQRVYRSTVYAVCGDGPAAAEQAARALVASRPWYKVDVQRVPLVAFTLLADLPEGNDRAVPAALAKLPTGSAVFYEGDDVSLTYAGPGVTQAQFDAAVAAFAGALGVPVSQVKAGPLAAR